MTSGWQLSWMWRHWGLFTSDMNDVGAGMTCHACENHPPKAIWCKLYNTATFRFSTKFITTSKEGNVQAPNGTSTAGPVYEVRPFAFLQPQVPQLQLSVGR